MVLAYSRVSTDRQNPENQRDEIERFAKLKGLIIKKWHKETVSGTKNRDNRMLGEILNSMKKGDVLIISEISRLSRTLFEIMEILYLCLKKNIVVHSVKEGYSFSDDMNSKILGFAFGLTAEVERNLISQRTKEALAQKKRDGVILGRPIGSGKLKILNKNSNELLKMISDNLSITTIAKKFNVSRVTIYKFIKVNCIVREPDVKEKPIPVLEQKSFVTPHDYDFNRFKVAQNSVHEIKTDNKKNIDINFYPQIRDNREPALVDYISNGINGLSPLKCTKIAYCEDLNSNHLISQAINTTLVLDAREQKELHQTYLSKRYKKELKWVYMGHGLPNIFRIIS